MSKPMYVIWSEEHGRWWRAGAAGYTYSLAEAGRYTKDAAEEIAKLGNQVIHPYSGVTGDRTFNEIAIPDPMAK